MIQQLKRNAGTISVEAIWVEHVIKHVKEGGSMLSPFIVTNEQGMYAHENAYYDCNECTVTQGIKIEKTHASSK